MNRAATIWIILGLVVVAIIAYFAFNRPADMENAGDVTPDTAQEAAVAGDSMMARSEARAELTTLRARAEAGETYDELASDFAQVRARVAASYANAEGEAAAEWDELQADFDSFEASAREGTSDLLDAFSNLIDRLSADIRVETETE